MSKSTPWPIILFFKGLGALFLLGAVAYFVNGWSRYFQSQNWPEVQGTVVSTAVRKDLSTRDTNSDPSKRHDNAPSYQPIVRYQYVAEGQKRQSEVISLNGETAYGTPEEANDILADYPVGGPVTARVNPEDPDDAVLEIDTPSWFLFILLSVFGFGFGGAGFLISGVVKSEGEQAQA